MFRTGNGGKITVEEWGVSRRTLNLDNTATVEFFKYIENYKKTNDFVIAMIPIPAGKAGNIASYVLKTLAVYDYFFGDARPGFDNYVTNGNQQGVTLQVITSFHSMGESTTYSIIMNSTREVIGNSSVIGFGVF